MTRLLATILLIDALMLAGCSSGQEAPDATATTPAEAPVGPIVDGVSVSTHPEVATILQVRWTQQVESDAVWIEYTFDNDAWFSTPPTTRGIGEHEAVILGLPADVQATFRFHADLDGEIVTSDTSVGTTGPLPEDLPVPTLTVSEPTLFGPQPWVLIAVSPDDSSFGGKWWVVVLDRDGRVVWYKETQDRLSTNWPAAALDGTHIVVDEIPFGGIGTSQPGVMRRLTLDLAFDEIYEVPAFWVAQESQGGRFLYDGGDAASDTWVLSELQPDGSHTEIWDCNAWLGERSTVPFACMPNTISWNRMSDSVLWSMWAIHTVVEVDLASGEVVRQFGELEGSWSFDPPESRFELQHYPNYSADGTLLVSCHVPDEPQEQRAREYRIDDDSETLVETWSYGEGVPRFAAYMGEAARIEGGNTLIGYGPGLALREVTPAGEVAWEVEWSEGVLAHATLVADLYPLNEGWPARWPQ